MGRLADVLERMWAEPRRAPVPPPNRFKAHGMKGKGDVKFFIQQFGEVAEANEWTAEAAILYLREALKEEARDCGRAATVIGIFAALRARYGSSQEKLEPA